jgi:hypothetical protein
VVLKGGSYNFTVVKNITCISHNKYLKNTKKVHAMLVLSHGMVHPQIAAGGDGIQTWSIAQNTACPKKMYTHYNTEY